MYTQPMGAFSVNKLIFACIHPSIHLSFLVQNQANVKFQRKRVCSFFSSILSQPKKYAAQFRLKFNDPISSTIKMGEKNKKKEKLR